MGFQFFSGFLHAPKYTRVRDNDDETGQNETDEKHDFFGGSPIFSENRTGKRSAIQSELAPNAQQWRELNTKF